MNPLIIFAAVIAGMYAFKDIFSQNTKQLEMTDASTEKQVDYNENKHFSGTSLPQTKNFKASEFACNDKAKSKVPVEYYGNLQELMNNLQVLRDHLGKPVKINSGFRTVAYNNSIPNSVKFSMHLVAKAADIQVQGYTPIQLVKVIAELIAKGKMKDGGIGLYDTFIHYDVGHIRRWNNSQYKGLPW